MHPDWGAVHCQFSYSQLDGCVRVPVQAKRSLISASSAAFRPAGSPPPFSHRLVCCHGSGKQQRPGSDQETASPAGHRTGADVVELGKGYAALWRRARRVIRAQSSSTGSE